MDSGKEDKMSRAEEERREVGLMPDEVGEINRPKPDASKSRSKINAAANVLAVSLTAVAGVGLAATVEGEFAPYNSAV